MYVCVCKCECTYVCVYVYEYTHICMYVCAGVGVHMCRGVETLSQLPDILAYFHHSCPVPHILCIQFSFNLPDIQYIYRTMSCMTGCFHTTAYVYVYMCVGMYRSMCAL